MRLYRATKRFITSSGTTIFEGQLFSLEGYLKLPYELGLNDSMYTDNFEEIEMLVQGSSSPSNPKSKAKGSKRGLKRTSRNK